MSFCFQAGVKKSRHELCSLEIFLDHLKDVDFLPLLDICLQLDNSDIEAVDIYHRSSSCTFLREYALRLMRATDKKLRVVDLHASSGKSFLRYIYGGVISSLAIPKYDLGYLAVMHLSKSHFQSLFECLLGKSWTENKNNYKIFSNDVSMNC